MTELQDNRNHQFIMHKKSLHSYLSFCAIFVTEIFLDFNLFASTSKIKKANKPLTFSI